jgi:CysZ protein
MLAREPAPPGFGVGLRAFFEGFRWLFRTPDAWPLALVPIGVALLLMLVFGALAIDLAPRLVHALLGAPGSAWVEALAILLDVLAIALGLALSVLLSLSLAKPLSGPALERLVRRVEADLGAPTWPPTSLAEDVLRSVQSTLVPLAVFGPLLLLLGVLGFLFAPAAVIVFPLQMAISALIAAWDLCDYPLSIRGRPVALRIGFVRRHVRAVLGFGLGLALLSFVPCALLLVLPAGVAGAARLCVELERWDAGQPG